jgi:general secretion pathway protein D
MPNKSAFFTGIVALTALTALPILAQQPGVQSTTERELRRRELAADYAQDAINKGTEAMMNLDYESAYAWFKSAVDSLPAGGEATLTVRQTAMDGFSRAVVKLTEQRISEGRYEDAETTIKVVLTEQYNPNYKPALVLLAKLKSPGTFNPTITPTFVANVEEVKQLLREAEGFYQSARYDLSFKRCEEVLNIDKYNIAARRMMEKINNARQKYSDTAYDQTRGALLTELQSGWELPVTQFQVGASQIIEQPVLTTRGTTAINRKLQEIRIPSLNFRETTIREAIDYIKKLAIELDTTEPDRSKRGVNIVLKLDPSQAAETQTRITLNLTDVPLRDALDYIARGVLLKVKVEPYAVAIVPQSEPTDVFITKEYRVPPGLLSNLPAPTEGAQAPGLGGFGVGGAAQVAQRAGAKEYFERLGVPFPTGASANFLAVSSKLIVKNTQQNLDVIDSIIEAESLTAPSQIEIESRFIEVTQNNSKELGFDWLLGQFQLPFGTGVYGGGGPAGFGGDINGTQIVTEGEATRTFNNAYPFVEPGQTDPIGATGTSVGSLTGGNRSGSTAITANALDGLLFASPTGPAAGVLALAGIFTNPQFQVVLRAINQSKGIDLMTAPKVTTKSGARATIQIIREFIYPTQFDPPQIPQSTGTRISPVTPSTPTQFEMRPLGVELEVEPTVGPDGFSIELVLSPRVTEFDGFINYGSPIDTAASELTFGFDPLQGIFRTLIGAPTLVRLSDNVMNQPVFSVRQVTTSVTVYDGFTVALGGLMREDIQKVEDKTPIIGDLPLVGRLFRTTAEQHLKRNLIMFVTATLMDPGGQPLVKEIVDEQVIAAPDPTAVESEIIPGDPLSAPSLQ